MNSDIYNCLSTDATMTGYLSGGIYTANTVAVGEPAEISRTATPSAFTSGGDIKPCAFIKDETITPVLPYETGSRQWFVVYFYQYSGTATIDKARERAFTLLNRVKVGSGVWEVNHQGDVLEQFDDNLKCSMSLSRYVATKKR